MNPFRIFVNSISRISSYELFLEQPLGKAMVYLLLLTVVFSGITSVKNAVLFTAGIDELQSGFATDVPEFEVRDGELFIDEEMPIIVEDTPEYLFVIDTSGELDESILEGHEQGIFLSRYDFTQKDGIRTQTYQFSDIPLEFNKTDVLNLLPALKWISVLIIGFSFVFFFVGKLISAVFVSVLGLIIEALANHKIGFGNLFKLSIYALTLSILLQFLINLSTLEVPFFGLIYYGLALFYLWKALNYLRTKASNHDDADTIIIE